VSGNCAIPFRAISLDRGDPHDDPPRLGASPCLTPNSAFSGLDPVQPPLHASAQGATRIGATCECEEDARVEDKPPG